VVDIAGRDKMDEYSRRPATDLFTRMEWAANSTELILQQLNRKQNDSKILLSKIATGETAQLYEEHDSA